MKYLIKPFEVKNTNNLGFGRSNSYIAEVVMGEVIIQKLVGSDAMQSVLNVGIYSLERDDNGGFDINNAILRESRTVKQADLTLAGVPANVQDQMFLDLASKDETKYKPVISNLIKAFGLELA